MMRRKSECSDTEPAARQVNVKVVPGAVEKDDAQELWDC